MQRYPSSGLNIALSALAPLKIRPTLGSKKIRARARLPVKGPEPSALGDQASIMKSRSCLAALEANGKITVWNSSVWQRSLTVQCYNLSDPGHEGFPNLPNMTEIAFSADGNWILHHWKNQIRRWDVTTGQPGSSLPGPEELVQLEGSPYVEAASTSDARIAEQICEEANRLIERVHVTHTSGLSRAGFSSDGKLLAAIGADGMISIWDASTGNLRGVSKGHERYGSLLAFSPRGNMLATSGGDRLVRRWETAHGGARAPIYGAGDILYALVWDSDSRLVTLDTNGKLKVWEGVRDLDALRLPVGHDESNAVSRMQLSPDEKTCLILRLDDSIDRLDLQTGKLSRVRNPNFLTQLIDCLATSRDGKIVAAAGEPGEKAVQLIRDGKTTYLSSPNAEPVVGLTVEPQGRFVAAGGIDGSITAWEIGSGRIILQTKPADGILYATGLSFLNSGRQLAACSADWRMLVWDLSSGRQVYASEPLGQGALSLAFAQHNSQIAIASAAGTIKVWDADRRTTTELHGHTGTIHSLTFSSDNRRLASASSDGTIRIWDLVTANEVLTLRLDEGSSASDLRFAFDNRRLVGVFDGDIAIWGGALAE
jgi:WD40 repeat protein